MQCKLALLAPNTKCPAGAHGIFLFSKQGIQKFQKMSQSVKLNKVTRKNQ